MANRRNFMMTVVASGGAVALASLTSLPARAAEVLSESDPQAIALGYKTDATKVDKAKYPQHKAGHVCSNCNFYQGKATDAMAPCQLFGGKLVAAKGWCSGYAMKTG